MKKARETAARKSNLRAVPTDEFISLLSDTTELLACCVRNLACSVERFRALRSLYACERWQSEAKGERIPPTFLKDLGLRVCSECESLRERIADIATFNATEVGDLFDSLARAANSGARRSEGAAIIGHYVALGEMARACLCGDGALEVSRAAQSVSIEEAFAAVSDDARLDALIARGTIVVSLLQIVNCQVPARSGWAPNRIAYNELRPRSTDEMR
ncbi:MAG TPA: hypothetical protein VNF29_16260 [Candidatus Binataceae bacterium]|nr:hypothetical protein [Candidatus Binataceae bacterium]